MSAAITIPVWAYLLLFAVVLLALGAGMWMGYGRGWDHCEEDQHYERLQAKDKGRYPAGKGRHRTGADMPGVLLELPPHSNEPCHPECFGPRCRCHRKTDDYLAYHRGEWPPPGEEAFPVPPQPPPVSEESWLAYTEQALAVVSEPATELQLVAAAPDPCCEPCDEYARLTLERVNRETAASETDSAFTRRMAVETDELIKSIRERSNYWRHLIQDQS